MINEQKFYEVLKDIRKRILAINKLFRLNLHQSTVNFEKGALVGLTEALIAFEDLQEASKPKTYKPRPAGEHNAVTVEVDYCGTKVTVVGLWNGADLEEYEVYTPNALYQLLDTGRRGVDILEDIITLAINELEGRDE